VRILAQILEHRFPSGLGHPVCGLSIALDEIANAWGLQLQSWDEDGLGPARGAFICLPSGRIVLLRELAHAVRRLGSAGPDIEADGDDIASHGIAAIVDDVVQALGLSAEVTAWREDEAAQTTISDILSAWRKRSG
jgi:hypothetical protein